MEEALQFFVLPSTNATNRTPGQARNFEGTKATGKSTPRTVEGEGVQIGQERNLSSNSASIGVFSV